MPFIIDREQLALEQEARRREMRKLTSDLGEFPDAVIDGLASAVHQARLGVLDDDLRTLRDGVTGATVEGARAAQKYIAKFEAVADNWPADIEYSILAALKKRGVSADAFNLVMEALEEGLEEARRSALELRQDLGGRPRSAEALFTDAVCSAVTDIHMNRSRRTDLVLRLMEAVPFDPLSSKATIYQRIRNREV